MGFTLQRKTFKIGSSHAVTLPAGWCQYYSGRIDTLTVIGGDLLILAPKGLEEKAERLMKEVEKERG